jgi:preprotein translocase subunit YajC
VGDGNQSLLFLFFMVAIFYLVLVRPQQKRVKKHQQVIAALKPGDEVVTIGGLYGYVREVDDAVVHLEVAPGTVLRYARSAVRDKIAPTEAAPGPTEAPTTAETAEGTDRS